MIPGLFSKITILIEPALWRIQVQLKLFHFFIGQGPVGRFNQSFINSNSFINRKTVLMELFKKSAVELNHGVFGKAVPEP